jgi:hypothetical protein
MDNTLQHVGILGMKWGHRKSEEGSSGKSGNPAGTNVDFKHRPVHPDHAGVEAIKLKGLKFTSDAELKKAASRMELLKKYKESTTPRTYWMKRNTLSKMSNKELKAETDRETLINAYSDGMKTHRIADIVYKEFQAKRIRKMSDVDVKKLVKRQKLEQKFKDLRIEELAPVKNLVNKLINIANKGFEIRGARQDFRDAAAKRDSATQRENRNLLRLNSGG